MTTLEEVHAFLEGAVKLDYNNWDGKEEFVSRLYTLLEKRYQ